MTYCLRVPVFSRDQIDFHRIVRAFCDVHGSAEVLVGLEELRTHVGARLDLFPGKHFVVAGGDAGDTEAPRGIGSGAVRRAGQNDCDIGQGLAAAGIHDSALDLGRRLRTGRRGGEGQEREQEAESHGI